MHPMPHWGAKTATANPPQQPTQAASRPPHRSRCTQRAKAPTPPQPRYAAKNTARGCLSRHLSRLDKHPRAVVTIRLRGGGPHRERNVAARRRAERAAPGSSNTNPTQDSRSLHNHPVHLPRQPLNLPPPPRIPPRIRNQRSPHQQQQRIHLVRPIRQPQQRHRIPTGIPGSKTTSRMPQLPAHRPQPFPHRVRARVRSRTAGPDIPRHRKQTAPGIVHRRVRHRASLEAPSPPRVTRHARLTASSEATAPSRRAAGDRPRRARGNP